MNRRMASFGVLAMAALAVPAPAQTVASNMEQLEAQLRVPAVAPRIAAVESRVTSGKPYSAEATTEFLQVLGDGNRITRKATVRIYRDGEGRTRREELAADGQVKTISIYDPVAHMTYVLDPVTRIATKSAVRIVYPEGPRGRGGFGRAAVPEKVTAEREAADKVLGKVVAPVELPGQMASQEMQKRQAEVVARGGGGGVVQPVLRGGGDAKTESLGQKMIDGVLAEGSRTTTVIPADAIGNQHPITIVAEQWFSPDLDILIMTRHSDPRTGESTYTVSNITRGEPIAGLFDVPADYTIKESSYMRSPALR